MRGGNRSDEGRKKKVLGEEREGIKGGRRRDEGRKDK